MDLSNNQEFGPGDAAYSPQVINEQDTVMQDDQSNNHSNGNPQNTTASPALEQDPNSRYNSPNLGYQPGSRPGSEMGHRPSQQQNKSSVVIKVGMVGDAQIGKTSLMVKYVEGSWDEDYIQTLGRRHGVPCNHVILTLCRCQLHGKDNIHTKHRNHFFHLGFGWSKGVRQHAPIGLQRCCRHTIHV